MNKKFLIIASLALISLITGTSLATNFSPYSSSFSENSNTLKVVSFHVANQISDSRVHLNLTHPTLVPDPVWIYGPFFYINESCKGQADNIRYAINLWQAETSNFVDFIEVGNLSQANLVFNCVDYFIDQYPENGHIYTTLGDTNIDNNYFLNNFTIIQRAEILLGSDKQQCSRPVKILHEIGHALGLAHTEDKSSIMYPIIDCGNTFTEEMTGTIKQLYGQGAIPNVYLSNTVALWSNGYLNVNTSVSNIGGKPSGDFQIYIEDNNKLVNVTDVKSLFIAETRDVSMQNISWNRLPSQLQLAIHLKIGISQDSILAPK